MADFSGLKKKSKLGVPPSVEEVKNNLNMPETYDNNNQNVDGRTLRKTGRTHQLATRVTYDFYTLVRQIAFDEKITIAELLEKSIDSYQKTKNIIDIC
ncbi:MAG: hypothetical protein HEEMFOPI_01506 [Holosporales bacterium]